MRNFEIKNNDCHAALAMTKSVQSGRSLLPESGTDAPTVLSAVYTDSTPAKNRQADVPQYGRSMIEMLGVLAIIGVLSVGGIAGYSKAMMKYRINKAIEQITLIAGNIRAFWGPQKNYIGVYCNGGDCDASGCNGHSGVNAQGRPTNTANGCPVIKKAKIFPDEMITVEGGKITSITNPFGGRVDLDTYSKAKSGDNQAFSVLLSHVPEEACIELLSNDWTNAGVKAYRVAGGPTYNKSFKAPLDVATAVDTCSKAKTVADGGYFIVIEFYFDIDINSTYWSSQTWEN